MRFTIVFISIILSFAIMPVQAMDAVVGTGAANSCTEAAFDAALATASNDGGAITFNCGGPATITFTSQKILDSRDNTIVIDGGGEVTLSGGDTTRLFRVQNGRNQSLTLRNITLANGRAQGYSASGDDNSQGGAVLFGYGNGTLRIENSTFRNNVAVTNGGTWDGGGAIHIRIGELFIENSLFEGNSAPNGGAMNILITTGTITNTVFRGNSATTTVGGGGGAIYIDNGMLTFDRILAENNTSTRFGAGYFNCGGSRNIGHETITNSTFRNNTITGEGTGAGVYNCDDGITIRNTTINNNTGPSHAGGFWHHSNSNPGSTATVVNTTISNNTASSGNGAGVVSNGPAPMTIIHSVIANNRTGVQGSAIRTGQGSVTLVNTIIANNSSAHEWVNTQCHGTIIDGGGNLQFPATNEDGRDAKCSAAFTTADPQLAPLADNGGLTQTHALQPGSPAIDAAASCGVQVDQRGVVRPQGAACDIGPYEFEGEAVTGAPADLSINGLNSAPVMPVFGWSDSSLDEWYQVELTLPNGRTVNLWYEATNICRGSICTAQAIQADTFGGPAPIPYGLTNGQHFWRVVGWSPGTGRWNSLSSNGESFAVSLPAPGIPQQSMTPTLTADSGFRWNANPNASWYRVYAAGDNGIVFDQWVDSAEVCSGDTCELPFSYYLRNGSYQWWMTSWGAGGMGPWTDASSFTLDLPVPDQMSGTAYDDRLEWSDDPNAAWYHVQITQGDSATFDQWYQGLTICEGGTCSVTVEANSGIWTSRAWGPGGMGQWNEGVNIGN